MHGFDLGCYPPPLSSATELIVRLLSYKNMLMIRTSAIYSSLFTFYQLTEMDTAKHDIGAYFLVIGRVHKDCE